MNEDERPVHCPACAGKSVAWMEYELPDDGEEDPPAGSSGKG